MVGEHCFCLPGGLSEVLPGKAFSWIFLYPHPSVSLECKMRRKSFLSLGRPCLIAQKMHLTAIEVIAAHMHKILSAASFVKQKIQKQVKCPSI